MSAETDDDDGRGIAWLPLLVSAAMIALIVIALIASWGDPSSSDQAAQPPAGTTATTAATAPATTGEETATVPAPATDDGTTATAPDDAAIPAEVRDDPVVQRLARGRALPFTAGPWRREVWRDAVYGRLRPATQERAEKVDVDGGFGILIQ